MDMMKVGLKAGIEAEPISAADTACRGCGTCCRKSGPALHTEDAALFASNAFGRADLVTVRAGELAFDQISGDLRPLEVDIVKFGDSRVRNSHGFMVGADESDATQAAGLGGCRFLVEQPKSPQGESRGQCGIYAHRPVECRALLCKDTRAIGALYNQDRLSRTDVLLATYDTEKNPYAQALIQLVEAHSEACSASSWHTLLHGLVEIEKALLKCANTGLAQQANHAQNNVFQAKKTDLYQKLDEFIRLDLAYREIAHEKAGVPVKELAFLFGRPLPHIALSYGIRI